MQCMKCGKETAANNAFCQDCLAEMEKYPVKPNVTVNLPQRIQQPSVKKKQSWRRAKKPEELLRQKRRLVCWLALTTAACIAAVALCAVLAVKLIEARKELQNVGQNYGVITDIRST